MEHPDGLNKADTSLLLLKAVYINFQDFKLWSLHFITAEVLGTFGREDMSFPRACYSCFGGPCVQNEIAQVVPK